MADSDAYDQQLRQQELDFEEKLRELRRRSAATPGSTPLVSNTSQQPHAQKPQQQSLPSANLEDDFASAEFDARDADRLGEDMFEELMQSSPLVRVPAPGSYRGGPGTLDEDEDEEGSNSLLDTDSDSYAGGAESTNGAKHQQPTAFAQGLKNEFFNDLVATPVDHLTSNRGQLPDRSASAGGPGGSGLVAEERDVTLNTAHLSEALHLQQRTTRLLHEIERSTPPPARSGPTGTPGGARGFADAELRNEDYMSPGYEYQSAAAMNLRLASQEALEAARAVQQQAVDKLEAQVKNTAAAVGRVRENTFGGAGDSTSAPHSDNSRNDNRYGDGIFHTDPVVQEVRLEKAQLSAQNARLQQKLYQAGFGILASISNARARSLQSNAFRTWFYVAARDRLNQATEMSIFQVQRYTQRARALAKFGMLLTARRRWKVLFAWKHWCSVTTVRSHEQKVQSLWKHEMSKQLNRQKADMDELQRQHAVELREARSREEGLRQECKALAEAGLSIRKVGDQRFESAVAAMKLELQDAADSQSLRFQSELEELSIQHERATEALAEQHARHLKSQNEAAQKEIAAKDQQLKAQEAATRRKLESKDKTMRKHVDTLQKRHGELLELTISDHDQQIKELVDSLKAHAAKVEQSARDRVKQVKDEYQQEQEAAKRDAQQSEDVALQQLRRAAADQQRQLVADHHEQLQEQEDLRRAMLAKQQQLVALHGEQIENLRMSEQAALSRAAEEARVQQIRAEEQYHEDLHAIVAKSRSQQEQLLATFEVQHERQTDEMLSDVALKQSEKLNELMEKCERRIEAEKLAAENEVQREAAAAKLNEGHALKVLEIQLNNEWKEKLQAEEEAHRKKAAEDLATTLKKQTAEQAAKITDIEASLARRFAQSQQLLVDELELGRDQSIIDTTRNQQQALQEVVEAAQAQKEAFEAELAAQQRALQEANDELEAQKVAHEALKADVAVRDASVEQATRSVDAISRREQQLRNEIEQQQKEIASLSSTNKGLRSTQQRVLAQDALQHLSMTMIERSITVRGLFEKLDRSRAGWLTREDFVNGIRDAFPISAPQHRSGNADGVSLFTTKQLEALFDYMDVHGTRRVGWETFASCFTRPGSHPHSPGGGSGGEELSPMRFGETKQHLDFLQKIQAPGQPRPPREGISHPSQRPNAPNSTQHRRRQRPNESAHAGHARRGEEKTEAPNQPTVSVLAGKGGRQLLTQMRLRQLPRAKLDRVRARLRASAYRHTDLGGWDLRRLFDRRDRNRDGSLDIDEFLATVRKELRLPAHEISDDDVQLLFDALDITGSGQLGVDQIYLLLADNDAPAGSFNLDTLGPNETNDVGGGAGNSVAGIVAAKDVLSPKSHRQLRQRERDEAEPRPRERSPSASLSMSMLQSANPTDTHRRGTDIDANEGEGSTGTDKWAARIKFLMKLYRMDVLNDKVLQKLSDRDLERSIKAVRAARTRENANVIRGVDDILSDALRRRGGRVPSP